MPIDFSPMGINFIIQPGMKGLIDSIMAYKGWDIAQVSDADNNLSAVIPAGSTDLVFVENTTCIIKDYENGTTESRMTTLKDLRSVIEWGAETI